MASVADSIVIAVRLIGIGDIDAIIHVVANSVAVLIRLAAARNRCVFTTHRRITGIRRADIAVVAIHGRSGADAFRVALVLAVLSGTEIAVVTGGAGLRAVDADALDDITAVARAGILIFTVLVVGAKAGAHIVETFPRIGLAAVRRASQTVAAIFRTARLTRTIGADVALRARVAVVASGRVIVRHALAVAVAFIIGTSVAVVRAGSSGGIVATVRGFVTAVGAFSTLGTGITVMDAAGPLAALIGAVAEQPIVARVLVIRTVALKIIAAVLVGADIAVIAVLVDDAFTA